MSYIIKKTTEIIINSMQDIDNYLKTQDTENCNIVNYAWLEYGFYPIFFNELFNEFFRTCSGKFIGLCFEGHEILYEGKVDDLLILKNFIDTTKTYKDNKETPLLIKNMTSIRDKGIAFWFTLRNFNEDAYLQLIYKYKFKNMILPIGKTIPWDNGLFPGYNFKYGIGENNFYTPKTLWNTGNLGWDLNLWKHYNFPNISNFKTKEYYTLFVKNTWKTRKYNSKNIKDYMVGNDGMSGEKGYGFVDINFYKNLLTYFINNNKKLIIISDLVQYPIPKTENIVLFNMVGFFDIKKFCSIVHNSRIFITSSTSPLDLASYYCDTHIVCLNDKQKKCSWVQKVLKTKNKTAISFDMEKDDSAILENFINKY
tara:strand:+ start:3987 stop:5090 length:1104 start_codon:yes stop_codon:yes gene_type:complete